MAWTVDATIVELQQKLAAAQAEAQEAREALMTAHRATEAAQEGTDIEGQDDASVLDAYEEGTCAVLRATTPILSRAPGDREALRAMLVDAISEAYDYKGSCEQAMVSIVARLLSPVSDPAGEKGA